jgi:hypothetical protein
METQELGSSGSSMHVPKMKATSRRGQREAATQKRAQESVPHKEKLVGGRGGHTLATSLRLSQFYIQKLGCTQGS